MENYITEAFKKLSLLEDDFNLSDNKQVAVDELQQFVADDVQAVIEEPIIDVNAETEEDLQDNYIGKVIIECACCHSRLYKNQEDIIVDEESDLVNIDEECPVCSTASGYVVIGKIEAFEEDKFEEEEDDIDAPIDEEPIDEEPVEVEEEEDEFVEALRAVKGQPLKEELAELEDQEDAAYFDREVSKLRDAVDMLAREAHYSGASTTAEVLQKAFDILDIYGNRIDEELENSTADEYQKQRVDNKVNDLVYDALDLADLADKVGADSVVRLAKQTAKMFNDNIEMINEGIENLSLDTETTHMEMTSDESGKVTVTTEPIVEAEEEIIEPVEEVEAEVAAEEMIAPLSDEEIIELENNAELEQSEEEFMEPVEEEEFIEEEPEVSEEEEFSIDEFDEESFDELGEAYLRRTYENVKSYNTTRVKEVGNDYIVEGVITFDSGASKPTSFKFNLAPGKAYKRNKYILEGVNATFTDNTAKKAYALKGTLSNGKFVSEQLRYSYKPKGALNESTGEPVRVQGKVKLRNK